MGAGARNKRTRLVADNSVWRLHNDGEGAWIVNQTLVAAPSSVRCGPATSSACPPGGPICVLPWGRGKTKRNLDGWLARLRGVEDAGELAVSAGV